MKMTPQEEFDYLEELYSNALTLADLSDGDVPVHVRNIVTDRLANLQIKLGSSCRR